MEVGWQDRAWSEWRVRPRASEEAEAHQSSPHLLPRVLSQDSGQGQGPAIVQGQVPQKLATL